MDWSEQLTRIRRWVRDPAANIFSDAFLRRLYNDEQNRLFAALGMVQTVAVIRTHPAFQTAYCYDHEWSYTDHDDGEVYQLGDYHDASEVVFLHIWEVELLAERNATTVAAGEQYTQPWEAWMATPAANPPPIPMPTDFHEAGLIAYDKEMITPDTKAEIMEADETWRTNQGLPSRYWRHDKHTHWIYLWPLPTLTWQDAASATTPPLESDDGVEEAPEGALITVDGEYFKTVDDEYFIPTG